jgi:hypothetical protein
MSKIVPGHKGSPVLSFGYLLNNQDSQLLQELLEPKSTRYISLLTRK